MIEGDAAAQFARDARASGLALPTSRRFNPRTVLVVIAALVAASLVFGYATNWVTLNRPAPNPLAHLPGCPPSGVNVQVSVEADASGGLTSLWPELATGFSTATGGCLAVVSNASSVAYTPLGAKTADAVVGPLLPASGALAGDTESAPLLISPVVVLVNSNGLGGAVNLTAAALAGAYLGTVSSWADVLLSGPNPADASTANVSVVHLAGPSAATGLLSNYLSEWNSSFATTVGGGPNVTWPGGLVAATPQDVPALVAAAPGRIGYVPTDACPSLPAHVLCAALQTATGSFALPTLGALSSAAALLANTSAAQKNDWRNLSGVAPVGSNVYPMLEVTYVTMYRDLGTAYGASLGLNESKWLVAAFYWVAADTSNAVVSLAAPYGYFPVPELLGFEAQKAVLTYTYLGNWILLPPSALVPGDNEAGEGSGETGEF